MTSRFVLPLADVGNGISPSAGAKLNFFIVGSTTIRKETFSDSIGTIPNANPVIADGDGLFPEIFIVGSYKVTLTDKNNVQIWEADPIQEFLVTVDILGVANTNGLLALTPSENPAGTVKTVTGDDIGNDYVVEAGVKANNPPDIISDATWDAATKHWKRITNTFDISLGDGVKGNPQTNVAIQVERDITGEGTSSHGINVADFFADDTQALNPFGSDIQIGDGSQTTEVINHVNDFQVTDKINLGGATITAHRSYVGQSLLESGTMGTVAGVSISDVLGGRDTPGFSTPNFEVDGTATVNNQTGLGTLIRHGVNPRSIHCAAGNTDAGALLTSGAAPVDLECPVTIRQATASTSVLSGALICTAGGMGVNGAIFGAGDISVVAAAPIFRLRSAANSEMGRIFHDGSIMRISNTLNNELHLGINNASKLEVQSDRFIPSIDSDLNLGDSSHRWIQLFATTTTISTSDETTKTNILPIDDDLLDAWADVEHVLFNFKDAVELKGDSARLHGGHIAQQVQSALEAKGIDGFKYALLCKDELKKKVKRTRTITRQKVNVTEVEVEELKVNNEGVLVRKMIMQSNEIPVTEDLIVYNDDGTKYMVDVYNEKGVPIKVEVMRTMPVMEEVEEEYEVEELSGEFLMGLRYEQCLIIETAYLRRELKKIKVGKK